MCVCVCVCVCVFENYRLYVRRNVYPDFYGPSIISHSPRTFSRTLGPNMGGGFTKVM